MRGRGILAIAVMAAASIAACSSGPVGTAGAVSTGGVPAEPCGLLTVGEAEGALNSDPLVAASEPGEPALCTYSLASGQLAAVRVTVVRDGAQRQFDNAVASNTYDPVDGVGDRAVQHDGVLWFMVDGVAINVTVSWGGNANDEASAKLIGRIMASRITTGTVPAELLLTPPPVLASKDPCKLLSVQEAATVLGTGPLSSRNNDAGGSNQPLFCFYSLADGTAALSTFLDPKDGLASWDSTIADVVAEPVAGVGDKAVFEAIQGKLWVLKGDTIFTVNAFTMPPESALEADRQLMEIILSHI